MIAALLAGTAQFGAVRAGSATSAAVVALFAVCVGLVYLLLVNLTKRKLGAPLIAAVLFGAHPFAGRLLADPAALHALGGVALGLVAGVLLARTPLQPRLLWPALAAYAASLPLAPQAAAIPFLVAAAAVAYHGLEPSRLFGKRLAPRFAVFLVPLAVWTAWSAWTSTARGFAPATGDVASIAAPFLGRVDAGASTGVAVVAALVGIGALALRRAPKVGWPLLAAGLTLLVASAIGDAWGASPTAVLVCAFLATAFAEGIEELFYRFGAAVAAPLLVTTYVALALLSHASA